jgi:hypothetical protein
MDMQPSYAFCPFNLRVNVSLSLILCNVGSMVTMAVDVIRHLATSVNRVRSQRP